MFNKLRRWWIELTHPELCFKHGGYKLRCDQCVNEWDMERALKHQKLRHKYDGLK